MVVPDRHQSVLVSRQIIHVLFSNEIVLFSNVFTFLFLFLITLSMRTTHDDYRSYLKNILADKVSVNPRYSLRAFSRQVGLAPGFLSEVLSGKKNLSAEASMKITSALKLSIKESEYFRILVQIELTKSPEVKLDLTKKIESFFPKKRSENLTLDAFRTISDWYHIAAVEITHLADLLSAESISKHFGIPIETLDHQDNKEKFIGSETMAFDPDDLPKVTQALEECFSKVLDIASKSKNKKRVYHLGIQFFNLSTGRKRE
jgi:transcriptional regulator with XRE-family HTH domain